MTRSDGAEQSPWSAETESPPTRPTWPRVAVVVAVLALAFVAARACQQNQVRITKDEAIGIAEQQVDFEPVNRQVRFLRQGLDRRPFWFVSLSIPAASDEKDFKRLVVVRVDANSGEVQDLSETERPGDGSGGNGGGAGAGGS